MADQTFTAGQVLTAAQLTTLQANSGLVPITPTSVNGTGVTLSGNTVSVAASTTNVSVNGVFTSAYTNYVAFIVGTATTDLDCQLRYRAGGTDLSTSVYQYASQGWFGAAANSAAATAQPGMFLVPSFGSGRLSSNKIDFFSPATASSWKVSNSNTSFSHSAVGIIVRNGAQNANSTTVFDGFTIVNAGNITATITVYAYRT